MASIIVKTIKTETKKFPLTLIASAFNENEVFLLYYVFIMKNKTKKKDKSRDELNLESALSSKLGSKVTIDDTKGKGKMTIKYYSYDELDGIIEKISS